MRTPLLAGAGLLLGLGGCAAPRTQLVPVAKEDVAAEAAIQRELVLRALAAAGDRLNALSWPLLAAATPLCATKTGYRFGFAVRRTVSRPLRSIQLSTWPLAGSIRAIRSVCQTLA